MGWNLSVVGMIFSHLRLTRCAGIACAGVVLVGIAGCAATAPAVGASHASKPPDRSCWPKELLSSEQPLAGAPMASGLAAAPVKANGALEEDGDDVRAQEVITDFPRTQIADPARDAVVLVSFTVRTTSPGGWELGKSMGILAFEDLGERGVLWKPVCPANPAEVGEQLRAGGHEPLPARIEPGQTASGWVAFVVPRTTTAMTLRLQQARPDGGWSASESPLMLRPTPGANPVAGG